MSVISYNLKKISTGVKNQARNKNIKLIILFLLISFLLITIFIIIETKKIDK